MMYLGLHSNGCGNHDPVKDLIAVSSACFGPVHRCVSPSQNLFRIPVVFSLNCDTDAHGDCNFPVAKKHGSVEFRLDPLGDVNRFLLAFDVIQKYCKLVTSQPCHGICGTQARGHPLAYPGEHFIPYTVSVLIVDPLKMIQIEEQYSK